MTHLIGNMRALGLATFLLTIPLGLAATLLATRDPFASLEIFSEWIGIGVLSQITMGLLMLIAYQLCRNLHGASQRAAVISAAILAGAVRGATLAMVADQAGLVGTADLPIRVLSSAGIFGMWLLAIGAALSANDRYAAERRALLAELVAVELLEPSHATPVPDPQAAQLTARVHARIEALRQALEDSATSQSPQETARILRAGIDDHIRPLSHELWREATTDPVVPNPPTRFLGRTLRTAPPLRWIIPILGIAFVLNSLVWNEFTVGLIAGVTFAATFIVLLLVFFNGQTAIKPSRAITALIVLLCGPPAAVWLVALALGLPRPNLSVVAMAIGGVLVVAMFTMAKTALADRKAEIATLRAEVDERILDAHVRSARQRQLSEAAANHLHNTVQARLTAAVLHLETAAETQDEQRTRYALEQASAVLATPSLARDSHRDPRQRLEDIVIAWTGIATISVHTPDAVANAARWHLAVDAIEEAVANAIRHGHATTITIRITEDTDALCLTVNDDSRTEGPTAARGLGDVWFDAISAGRWQRTPTPTGAELSLTIERRSPW